MKPVLRTFAFFYLFIASMATHCQTTLPYFCGFEPADMGWIQVRKAVSGTYSWVVTNYNQFSGQGTLIHLYPVGGSPTDDWYISPPFDLSSGGAIDSLRYAFSGYGMPYPNDTVAVYLLSGSTDPYIAQKTLLFDFRGAEYNYDNTWRKKTNLAIPPSPGISRIGFKYVTVQNWLDVFFDNLAISCKPPDAPTNLSPPGKLTICTGKSTTLSATATGTISWYDNATQTVAINTGTAFTTPTLSTGTHTYYAETEGCTHSANRTAVTVTVSSCAGLADEMTARGF
jgi:hypothetical protein